MNKKLLIFKSQISNLKYLKGFTLIELLAAVAIISILAIVAVVIFKDMPKRAEEAKRKADIDAIVAAYESTYDANSKLYRPLAADDFINSKIPTPPGGGNYEGLLAESASSFEVCTNLTSGRYCKKAKQGTYMITPVVTP